MRFPTKALALPQRQQLTHLSVPARSVCPACSMALLVRWLLLCTGKLCENAPEITAMALREQVGRRAARGALGRGHRRQQFRKRVQLCRSM